MAKDKDTTFSTETLLAADFQEKQLKGVPFEQGMKVLGELVSKVEAGALPLEQALQAYERGAVLLEQLRTQLESAEERLRVIGKRSRAPEVSGN